MWSGADREAERLENTSKLTELEYGLVWSACKHGLENFKYVVRDAGEFIRACDRLSETVVDVFENYFIGIDEELVRDSVVPAALLYVVVPLGWWPYVCTVALHGAFSLAAAGLRLMVEALVLSVYVDTVFPDKSFEGKLDIMSREYDRFSRIVEKLQRRAQIDDKLVGDIFAVWRGASAYLHFINRARGAHVRGLLHLAEEHVEEHGAPPSGLTMPLPTDFIFDHDAVELRRLEELIELTTRIISGLLEAWATKLRDFKG